MIDDVDHAGAVEAAAMERFEEAQARQRLIAASLKPFDPSLPVNCVDCGEVVSAARLNAMPRTRRCAQCAAEVERGYKARWPA